MVRKSVRTRRGCPNRGVVGLSLILVLVCSSSAIATQLLVRQAEDRYPAFAFVRVDGTRLHYASQGSGRPVVLIHGGSGRLQDFTLSPLFPQLSEEFFVIALDRPGLGYSGKPDDQVMSPSAQARLIRQALDRLGVEEPLLVGQSWGGVVALAYALDYPQATSGIVLLGSAPYPRERRTDPFMALARLPLVGNVLVHTLYVPIGHYLLSPALLQRSANSFAPLTEVPTSFYDATLWLGLRPRQIMAEAKESVVIPASLELLSEHLHELELPVSIVAGELDGHALEQALRMETEIPGSALIVVEGAGHYFWYAHPEVVVQAIRDTWDRVGQEMDS